MNTIRRTTSAPTSVPVFERSADSTAAASGAPQQLDATAALAPRGSARARQRREPPCPPPTGPLPPVPQQLPAQAQRAVAQAASAAPLDDLLARIQQVDPINLGFVLPVLEDYEERTHQTATPIAQLLAAVHARDFACGCNPDDDLAPWGATWGLLAINLCYFTPAEVSVIGRLFVDQPLWGANIDFQCAKSRERSAAFRLNELARSLASVPQQIREHFFELAASDAGRAAYQQPQPFDLSVPLASRNSEALSELACELPALIDDQYSLAVMYLFVAIESLTKRQEMLDFGGARQLLRHIVAAQEVGCENPAGGLDWQQHVEALLELEHLRLAEAAAVGTLLIDFPTALYKSLFNEAHRYACRRVTTLRFHQERAAQKFHVAVQTPGSRHAQTLREYAIADFLECYAQIKERGYSHEDLEAFELAARDAQYGSLADHPALARLKLFAAPSARSSRA